MIWGAAAYGVFGLFTAGYLERKHFTPAIITFILAAAWPLTVLFLACSVGIAAWVKR